MTDRSRKQTEPPLKLDMDFGEALERFLGTDSKEVSKSVARSKTKKPPEQKLERPTAASRRRKPDADH